MLSFRSLLAAAPLLALAVAQKVAFTSVPATIAAGSSWNITWGGGDGNAVSLTLRKGDPENLSTVAAIADGVTVSYYEWTVPSTLQAADDYALQITQGQDDINYSGLFSITGGSGGSGNSTTPFTMTAGNTTMTMTGAAGSGAATGTAMSRNTTFSTASLTTSSHSSATHSSSSSGSSSAAATQSTSAPSNDAPIKAGSSAALILGIVAAVMLH